GADDPLQSVGSGLEREGANESGDRAEDLRVHVVLGPARSSELTFADLERVIATRDDVQLGAAPQLGEQALELGERAQRIEAALNEEDRGLELSQHLIPSGAGLAGRLQRIAEADQPAD